MEIAYLKTKYNCDSLDFLSNVSTSDALKMISRIKDQFNRNIGLTESMVKNSGVSGKISKNLLNQIKKMAKSNGVSI